MSAPAAVAAIMARVSEVAQGPAALGQIRDRFAAMMPGFDPTTGAPTTSTASASAAGTSATATSSSPTPARPGTTLRTNSFFGTQVTTIDSAGSGNVLTGASTTYTGATSALSSSLNSPATLAALAALPTPTGTWVDRIPNARGKQLAPAIAAAAKKYNLDPALLSAVYWTESSYTPDAVSRTGAIGLGQLMPETAEWLHVDPWDPIQNIDGSARMYRYLLDKQGGNLDLAIASYAAGIGAVKRAGGVPDQFTANYITKLTGRMDYLNGLRSTPP